MFNRRFHRVRTRLTASLVLALAITACGDDSDDADKPDSGLPGQGDAQVSPEAGLPGIDASVDAGVRSDAGPTTDAGTTSDAGTNAGLDAAVIDAGTDAGTDAGPVIPTLNGCAPGDYEDLSAPGATRTILFGGPAGGQVYKPKCATIAAGQVVRFQGNFNSHPLAPGNAASATAGSPNNPITSVTSGSDPKDFTFAAPGTYPYYCTDHSTGAGLGMAGSIHVK
jgi:plastocyanin